MAVKPEKIAERLKVLYPKANLSKKRMDEFSAKLAPKPADDADDEAVDVIIRDANELIGFETIAAEDDRVRGLEAKAKATKTEPAKPEEEEEPKPEDDAPAWAKPLFKKLEALESGVITDNKTQQAKSIFEKSEVLKSIKPEHKEKWLKRIDLESEIPYEDQVKELETEFTDMFQASIDSKDFKGVPPANPAKGEPSKDLVQEVVKNIV